MNTEQKVTLTDNELIAEFMGLKPTGDIHNEYGKLYWVVFMEGTVNQYTDRTDRDYKTQSPLMYHKSWDWLMPVVEKIDALGHDTDIMHLIESRNGVQTIMHYCSIQKIPAFEPVCYTTESTKRQAVYKAVIEFIKWYNTQKTTE